MLFRSAPRAAFPSGCLAAQTKRWAEGISKKKSIIAPDVYKPLCLEHREEGNVSNRQLVGKKEQAADFRAQGSWDHGDLPPLHQLPGANT